MKAMFDRFHGRPVAMCLLFAVLSGAAHADDSSFTSTAGVAKMSGGGIYDHICQGCHMPQGAGAVGAGHYPKLAGNPALISWEYVALTVLGGKNGMPAFGLPPNQVLQLRAASLTDAQIADVVNYVRGSFGNHYKSKVTARDVARLPHPSFPMGSD